jgi:hypothetical protein
MNKEIEKLKMLSYQLLAFTFIAAFCIGAVIGIGLAILFIIL